ncbi:MAG TPA: hypothetical protein VM008_10760 [Phycisphaerae bacterium]|nr:hypothetical protein [Phycisphaerae bacterium]
MKNIAQFRFFCSHNAFDLYDAQNDPLDLPVDINFPTSKQLQLGWYRRGDSICYRTVSWSNDHRIDITTSKSAPKLDKADRLLAHNLSFPTGQLTIFALDTGKSVSIKPGDYTVYCREFNLGLYTMERLLDRDFLARNDLERYQLILVPGSVKNQGVIAGPPTLEPFQKRFADIWNKSVLKKKLRQEYGTSE